MLSKIKNIFLERRDFLSEYGMELREFKKIKKGFIEGGLNKINLFDKPFFYTDKDAFLHSIKEIFFEKVYSFETESINPVIVDCGANIGLSIIYFKNKFPTARIIAFEPDPFIFKILERNILERGYEGVCLLNKGVWDKEEVLTFYSEGKLAGSIVTSFVENSAEVKVETVRLGNYLKQSVDFLKIDIEGAEYNVIKDINEDLLVVKSLFIEYHSIKDEAQKLNEILEIISRNGFRYYINNALELKKFNPFKDRINSVFDLQLNISCYRD